MNNKIIATILGVFVLAFMVTASPVMAAEVDVDASNEQTGADSDNDNKVIVKDEGNETVNNAASVLNKAKAKVNTGKNDQNMNTTGGDLETGDVDATTDWETVINDGFGLCGCPFGGGDTEVSADFLNKLTGYNSDNDNLLVVKDEGDTTVNNAASVLNKLGLKANTGKNDQNMNTTAGDMETGDISLDAGISNWINTVDGDSDGSEKGISVDVDASNEQTGADSNNDNKVIVKNEGNQTLNNSAEVTNRIKVKANTGYNDQNQNTTAGDLKTGDIDVNTDIQNVVNTGNCCPSGGNTSVSADLSNDTTGYNSDNDNKVIVKDEGNQTVNNAASVENSLKVDANTGGNDQNQNTTAGSTDTGDASVNFSSTTVVNSVE